MSDELTEPVDDRVAEYKRAIEAIVLVAHVNRTSLRAVTYARAANPDVLEGVTVDVDSAVSIQDDRVEPPQALTAVQFFDAIDNGTPVQVQSGTYNPGPNTITGGQIEIED